MSVNNDTNILYRRGIDVLEELKGISVRILKNNDFTANGLTEISEFCMKQNISPGGSADLLALSIFIYALENLKI